MKGLLRDILIAAAAALIIIQFIRPTVVKETSMEDTLHPNDYIFTLCQAYRFGEPAYGDIIVFESDLMTEDGRHKLLIKRVIGRPGDTVEIHDNQVILNGEGLYEEYIREQGVCPGELSVIVPEGSLFVMGDNRRVSVDSRYEDVGCVDMKDVRGKAVYRLFPFGERTKL